MDTPLLFNPLPKVRVWGGDILKSRSTNPPADPVGESWEIADHGSDSTCIRNAPLAGTSLHELMENHAAALCGRAIDPASPHVFPLMLKIIDPQSDLSVQVHPDDAYAGAHHDGELGKTEAWFVLDAESGAVIYRGWNPGTTKELCADALQAGTVADLLHAVPVCAGDVVFLPAGTVHALGAGVRIAEIQQNSDTTYRVFDWNRVGLDGQPRELHVDHALAVMDFSGTDEADLCIPQPLQTPGCTHERYIECAPFVLERMRGFREMVTLDTGGERFHILTAARGGATVRTAGGEAVLGTWDSVLVPAGAGAYTVQAEAEADILLFYRPGA